MILNRPKSAVRGSLIAGLLAGGWLVCPQAKAGWPAPNPNYQGGAAIRLIDLDTRGRRGQVMEYDGKVYKGAHGDVWAGGQRAEGLFDFSVTDIGSGEENVALEVDHKAGFRGSVRYQTMHHRWNFMRIGQLHDGAWVPKDYTYLDASQSELVVRRSETDLKFGWVSPEDNARFATAQFWNVDKVGMREWRVSGNPLIYVAGVTVDNTKRDLTLSFGTPLPKSALALDVVRSHFGDYAGIVASPTDGGTGSANNGGQLKRYDARQNMTGAELRFRHNVNEDLALTGAVTGRQRVNVRTNYRFNAAVATLNAAYRASSKLSLLSRFYLRAFMIDEDLGYTPIAGRGDARTGVNTHQLDKTVFWEELSASYRPIAKASVKASYKIEVTNRRDAPTQIYDSVNKYFSDGYVVTPRWDNRTSPNDTRHLFTLEAEVELPHGLEAEVEYKKLKANWPAFVNLPNVSDEWNGDVTAELPHDVTVMLLAGYLREKNTITNFTQYSQTRDNYGANVDWAMTNKVSFGADINQEIIRYFSELYLGSGSGTPTGNTAYHASVQNRMENTTYGGRARVVLPKGFVATASGSYARSTITTPVFYRFATATMTDLTPSAVAIARGRAGVEYTPPSYKFLTARASYELSDWVDKFDVQNSGRASIAQAGVSVKF